MRLTEVELTALSAQGFVCRERRGTRSYYKLRFRLQGRQRVLYVGSDLTLANEVQLLLDRLQSEKRIKLELAYWCRMVGQQLRDLKRRLAPLLEAAGFAFHGQAIRRPRIRASGEVSQKSQDAQGSLRVKEDTDGKWSRQGSGGWAAAARGRQLGKPAAEPNKRISEKLVSQKRPPSSCACGHELRIDADWHRPGERDPSRRSATAR